MSADSQLFDDRFTITSYDQSKYDRVARIGCVSDDGNTTFQLDVNVEMFPCAIGEHIQMVLASTLNLDGSKDSGKGWLNAGKEEPSLADPFDYVCHGKIYKFEDEGNGDSIKVFTSFGGMLLALTGSFKKLTPLRVDYIYMLLKK